VALKKARAGELVLLSQDEARFQMVPTLAAALGVKGHRPQVGTRDCKDVLYVFAVLNLISGALHANTHESLRAANRKSGESKNRRMQRAFADHLRHVAAVYPAGRFKRVVLTIDNAPWHRGALVDEALKENPQLELYRLPSYSPRLNLIERFWRKLRRRATHNRLFDTITDLKASVRNSLRYFQTVRTKLLTLINGRPKKSPR
jgi:transposase